MTDCVFCEIVAGRSPVSTFYEDDRVLGELGPLKILLSGPAASGSRPLPGGVRQEPGGSNRAVLRVQDLPGTIETLRSAGAAFRNTMEAGPGGRQIQVLDPDGNPIELFEPGAARQMAAILGR